MSSIGEDNSGKKVLVGLTGRVASCVAAFLLKKQGFDVIGMTIVTNQNKHYEHESAHPKCHVTNLDKVKDFCDSLNIPFYATEAKSRFAAEVIDPLLGNKLVGRANSSCFNCTDMRIAIMYEKMKLLKADYIATGHFSKIHKNIDSDEFFVHSNGDPDSDQSFLLSNLDPLYLRSLILPLGELRPSEIEKISQKFKLKLAEKSSVDKFCFNEKSSYSYYLNKQVPQSLVKEGQIFNLDTDSFLEDHDGMINHYITEPYGHLMKPGTKNQSLLEVIKYSEEDGTIFVGEQKHLAFKGAQLLNVRTNSTLDTRRPIACYMKNKYSNQMVKCDLYFKNNHTAFVEFESLVYPIIKGEILVFFDRDIRNAKVIGRGVVSHRGGFELVHRAAEFKRAEDAENDDRSLKF